MYFLIRFALTFLGVITGFMLADIYKSSSFFVTLFPENTMFKLLLLFGSVFYLLGAALAYFINGLIKSILDKVELNKVLPQIIGIFLGILLANLLLIPFYLLELDKQNIVLKYFKIVLPLFFNVVFAYIGGKIGEKYIQEFKNVNGIIIDTNLIINAKIDKIAELDIFKYDIIIPDFIVEELNMLADSGDRIKREKGRYALDKLEKLKNNNKINIENYGKVSGINETTDEKIIKLAESKKYVILSNDYGLIKQARVKGIKAVFFKDLEDAFKSDINYGDRFVIEIVKKGKERKQGVGYLEDGTMVVVYEGDGYIGKNVEVIVDNIVGTSAGKIIFAKIFGGENES